MVFKEIFVIFILAGFTVQKYTLLIDLQSPDYSFVLPKGADIPIFYLSNRSWRK